MKNYDNGNRVLWGNVVREHQMLYPNERVIAFLAKNYGDIQNNKNRKALDVGFGSGRHLKAMLDYQFEVYGIDYSPDSLEECRKILGEEVRLSQQSIDENYFSDCYFDVILLFGMIFFRTKEEMEEDLKEVYRLLKRNGKILVNFRTKHDFLYGAGTKVKQDTYQLDSRNQTYQGMLYTFLDKNEVQNMLEDIGFVIENIEREDYWKNNLSEQHSWWIFTASKGENNDKN